MNANENFARAKAKLDEMQYGPCSACGTRDWAFGPTPLAIPEGAEHIDLGQGAKAVALVCTNCGLINLHSMNLLLDTDQA